MVNGRRLSLCPCGLFTSFHFSRLCRVFRSSCHWVGLHLCWTDSFRGVLISSAPQSSLWPEFIMPLSLRRRLMATHSEALFGETQWTLGDEWELHSTVWHIYFTPLFKTWRYSGSPWFGSSEMKLSIGPNFAKTRVSWYPTLCETQHV